MTFNPKWLPTLIEAIVHKGDFSFQQFEINYQ